MSNWLEFACALFCVLLLVRLVMVFAGSLGNRLFTTVRLLNSCSCPPSLSEKDRLFAEIVGTVGRAMEVAGVAGSCSTPRVPITSISSPSSFISLKFYSNEKKLMVLSLPCIQHFF